MENHAIYVFDILHKSIYDGSRKWIAPKFADNARMEVYYA